MSQPPPQHPPGTPPAGGMPPEGWGPTGPAGRPPRRRDTPLVVALIVSAVALVGGGILLVTLGGGDDGPSDDEQAYIDALAEMDTAGQQSSTDEQSRCMAEVVVDVIGVDRLREAATPEEIRENASGEGISALGIRLDEDQATAVYDRGSECIDYRQLVLDSLRQRNYTDQQVECVDQYLTEDLLRDSVVAGIMEDAQAAQEASAAIDEATAPCSAAGA